MESRWDSYHSSANELDLGVPMACQVELVCKKNIHKKQKRDPSKRYDDPKKIKTMQLIAETKTLIIKLGWS